ncbi:MAG: hypothetical protein HY820_14185 [Acidobacteria bacterium]|nr:hypothetical protein [Acidobacteriota bacterium]
MHPEPTTRFGFSFERGSPHLARTMMLDELRVLLETVPATATSSEAYIEAIEGNNCLGKRSVRTRALSRRHLVDLYSLNPGTTLFRTLRYFWQRDPDGHALLACLCACARDPLLRASAPSVLKLGEGQSFSWVALEEHLEKSYPGRFSKATLKSTAQNLASTWTQSGHLSGRVRKVRARARATAGATAYALLLGFLSGERGAALFATDYAKLLDCSFARAAELAESASQRGWIIFKRVSNVIDVQFPALLTAKEMGWIRE